MLNLKAEEYKLVENDYEKEPMTLRRVIQTFGSTWLIVYDRLLQEKSNQQYITSDHLDILERIDFR